MYQVNLLPWRAERLKQRGQRYLILLSVLTTLVLLIGGWCDRQWRKQGRFYQLQRAVVAQEQQNVTEQLRLRQQAQTQLARLQEQYQAWQRLQRHHQRYLNLLQQLPRVIPDSVWLTSLQDRGAALEIRGISREHAASIAFVTALAAGDEVGKVMLTESQRQQDQHYRFTLLASWESEENPFE